MNKSFLFKAPRQTLSLIGSTRSAAGALLGLLLLPACSSYLTDGVVTITTGQETDAWTTEPAAQNVVLQLVQGTTRTTLANVAAPVTRITIGTEGPQNTVASFETTGFDASANVVMTGSTVPFGLLGFEGVDIPLFMGRVGGLSRAPGDLLLPHRHPQVAILYHGYVLISSGDDPSPNIDVYNMAHWLVAPSQAPLPKVPESWAISGSKLLVIDHDGATWLDTTTYATSAVIPPAGLDFSAIVGGQTVGNPGDPQYIVGATRTLDEATNQVLRVDPDATLHLLKLGTPRLGAAAAIMNGKLLVVGGSDTGAGAEIEDSAGTAFAALPFPPDARVGAALAAQDENTAILAGGHDPKTDEISGFRTLALDCAEDCAQVELPNADFAFEYPRLFSLGQSQMLAVGEDPKTGETRVFSCDPGAGYALNESPLRVPRSSASAVMLPNGQVGVLGGDALADQTPATSVELFFPVP